MLVTDFMSKSARDTVSRSFVVTQLFFGMLGEEMVLETCIGSLAFPSPAAVGMCSILSILSSGSGASGADGISPLIFTENLFE